MRFAPGDLGPVQNIVNCNGVYVYDPARRSCVGGWKVIGALARSAIAAANTAQASARSVNRTG